MFRWLLPSRMLDLDKSRGSAPRHTVRLQALFLMKNDFQKFEKPGRGAGNRTLFLRSRTVRTTGVLLPAYF